jgi:hypothetical protein
MRDLAGLCNNMGAMTMGVGAVVADASAASLHEWWGEEPSSISPFQAFRILYQRTLVSDAQWKGDVHLLALS